MSPLAEPPVTRQVVDAFYQAYAKGDVARLAELIDDDASWTINGPVELLQFCGKRRGKQAVIEMVGKLLPQVFEITAFVPEAVLIDGDRAATLNRLSGRRPSDGRSISYRVAQFVRFRDGKVIEYCSVIDSFDAAEQVLGRPIILKASQPADYGARVAV
jgi:ketosteroid isomerase-like protein